MSGRWTSPYPGRVTEVASKTGTSTLISPYSSSSSLIAHRSLHNEDKGRKTHLDNGGSMKGATMLATLQRPGIVPSLVVLRYVMIMPIPKRCLKPWNIGLSILLILLMEYRMLGYGWKNLWGSTITNAGLTALWRGQTYFRTTERSLWRSVSVKTPPPFGKHILRDKILYYRGNTVLNHPASTAGWNKKESSRVQKRFFKLNRRLYRMLLKARSP